jgi:hypothetical protein
VLINLLPEFLSVIDADEPEAAYARYREAHRPVLDAYWRNYVLDPDSAQAQKVVRSALSARRDDLRAVISSHNLEAIAEDAAAAAAELLQLDRPADVYLMVGMGAANAGELVMDGRGAAFICVEHFTGRPNAETYGMGLAPELIPVWLAHELAHVIRYTSPTSASGIRRLVEDNAGYYDYWITGSRATLRELLVNEGLAVHAAQQVAPGFAAADYFGYARRQYNRLREMESLLRRITGPELDFRGLGLRLRYLTGGMSPSARLVNGRVLPERSGYYLGWRMADAIVRELGIATALRASAEDITAAEEASRGTLSA